MHTHIIFFHFPQETRGIRRLSLTEVGRLVTVINPSKSNPKTLDKAAIKTVKSFANFMQILFNYQLVSK